MTDKNAFNFFKAGQPAMTTPTNGLEVNSPSMSTSLSSAERRSHNTGANLNMFKTYAVTAFALVISAFVLTPMRLSIRRLPQARCFETRNLSKGFRR
jgi:hypothetical protein